MTTTDFYNFAVMCAKERGFENPIITTTSMCHEGTILHSCQLWDSEKGVHINSKLCPNPVSAIQSFKYAIDFHNKTYSNLTEDIEL